MAVTLKTAAAEMEQIGAQAHRLAGAVQEAVGGSATQVDRELIGALTEMAKHMKAAALTLHHADRIG